MHLPLNTIEIYCNDNRTRTFLSLAFVDTESINQRHLCDIVSRLDKGLAEFKLEPFYKVSATCENRKNPYFVYFPLK